MLQEASQPETANLRAALVESERLAGLGRISATVAHELKNPLQGLSDALYLLEQNCAQDENTLKYFKIARQELSRAIEITKLTLGFARSSEKPLEVNVSATIEEILKFYDHKIKHKQVQILADLHSDAKVLAFPGEVRQIFINLVINALEAVEQGQGRVRIRCRTQRSNGIPGIRVTIADNGAGLAASSKGHVFQSFFTTKGGKGTGLGLWLTHGLVEKHHGTIKLRSSSLSERHGVTVSVFLPQRSWSVPEKDCESVLGITPVRYQAQGLS